MVTLKSHQKLPIKFMKFNFGLILYHSTGAGKTITSLVAMHQFNKHIIIIGPKSSKKAFLDEISKLQYDINQFTIYSFSKIKSIIFKNLDIFKNKCIIVDEAHHLRSQTKNNVFLSKLFHTCFKIMLLTATPIINYLNDIAPLINIVKRGKGDVFPTDRNLFNFFYFDEHSLTITNKPLISNKLRNTISHYEIKSNLKYYPNYKSHTIKIEMSSLQFEEYKNYLKLVHDQPSSLVDIDILLDFDMNLTKRKKNYFLSATRQLSNTLNSDINSPKILAIYKKIRKGAFPIIIYSNYLKNGIFTMAKKLNKHNISLQVITGSTTSDQINSVVNNYNKRMFNVLLISSAGSESLDLKNTRQIHIMEPHWNEAKIKQVIGRAIRYQSHSQLPIKQRFVDIYRWISIFPKPFKNQSADEYLTSISERKTQIYKTFKKIIIDSSIEFY